MEEERGEREKKKTNIEREREDFFAFYTHIIPRKSSKVRVERKKKRDEREAD